MFFVGFVLFVFCFFVFLCALFLFICVFVICWVGRERCLLYWNISEMPTTGQHWASLKPEDRNTVHAFLCLFSLIFFSLLPFFLPSFLQAEEITSGLSNFIRNLGCSPSPGADLVRMLDVSFPPPSLAPFPRYRKKIGSDSHPFPPYSVVHLGMHPCQLCKQHQKLNWKKKNFF